MPRLASREIKEPEVKFAEIVLRADRRLGQMLAEQKAAGAMAQGGRPPKEETSRDDRQVSTPTLKELGITRDLSARAQKLAAVPEEKFEGMLGEWREEVSHANTKVTRTLLREGGRMDFDPTIWIVALIIIGFAIWYFNSR